MGIEPWKHYDFDGCCAATIDSELELADKLMTTTSTAKHPERRHDRQRGPKISRRAAWWRDEAAKFGAGIIDASLRLRCDQEELFASGKKDIAQAVAITGIRTGRDLRLLEIGCGMGRCTAALAALFGEVVSLDVNPSFVEWARRHNRADNVTFRVSDGATVRLFPDGTFDVVFCAEVFHHLEANVLATYFREAHDLLRQGGEFVFQINVVPLRWRARLAALARRCLFAIGKTSWRGCPTAPGFGRVYHTPEALQQMLAEAGFTIRLADSSQRRQAWFVGKKEVAGLAESPP